MDQDIPALRFANFKNKWQETTLGEVSTITMGQSPKSSAYNNLGLGLPLIQGNADIKNRRSMPQLYTTQITKEIDKNDVLLTVRAPVGHVALSNHNACIGRGVAGIKATDNTFIFYSLLKNEHQWLRYSQGSTFTSINSDVIDQFLIKIPSEDEQAEIGKFFEVLDQNLKAKEKEIKKMNELKKAYMQQIFNQQLRFKNNNDQAYPSWESKKLKEVAEIFSGGTPATTQPKYWNGKIPWATPTEITTDNKYIIKTKRNITHEGLLKSSAKLLPSNSILMTSRATIGSVAINLKPMTTNQGFKSFVPTSETDTEFLYYYLQMLEETFKRLATGSTFLEISMTATENVTIKIPILEEQKKIGKFLSLIDQKIELKNQELEKIKKYKKAFLEKMFV